MQHPMRHPILRIALLLLGLIVLWISLIFLASATIQSRVPVNLQPFSSVIAISNNYVNATGTWVIDGDIQAIPLQTTDIKSERELKRCTSATAMVMIGTQLHAHLETYEIVNWKKTRVVFIDDSPSCVDYIYTIDMASKSAAAIRKKKLNGTGLPGDCAVYEKELRLTLRGGLEVMKKLQQDATPWFGSIVFAPFKLLQ